MKKGASRRGGCQASHGSHPRSRKWSVPGLRVYFRMVGGEIALPTRLTKGAILALDNIAIARIIRCVESGNAVEIVTKA